MPTVLVCAPARRRRADLAEELVEEQAPQRLRRARVAREQRALDRFRQVGQREDRAIGVGEVRRERARFLRRERFSGGIGEATVVGYSTAHVATDSCAYRASAVSVRFRDCDAMGHVNHAVYFTYLEQCRLTFWRELTGAPSPHTRVIIARAECDYRAPAYFGDELEVRLKVGDIGRSSFTLELRDRPRGERPRWSRPGRP